MLIHHFEYFVLIYSQAPLLSYKTIKLKIHDVNYEHAEESPSVILNKITSKYNEDL